MVGNPPPEKILVTLLERGAIFEQLLAREAPIPEKTLINQIDYSRTTVRACHMDGKVNDK